jgi:hypothetical protein
MQPGEATLTITRESLGATVISSPQDITNLQATFFVPDAADPTQLDSIPGQQAQTNVWSAQVGSANPSILYTLPDGTMYPELVVVPSQAVHVHFDVTEHPNPQPPPMAAMEHVMLTLPSPYMANETFDVSIVGAWMQHTMASTELPAPDMGLTAIDATIPYAMFNPVTASPAAAISASDAVLVLRYVGPLLTGVDQQPGFDQSPTMDTIGGAVTMDAVTASKTLTATIAPSTFNSRLQTVRPGLSPASLAMSWSISATPGYSIAAVDGPQLTAGSSAMADTMIMTSYGNPFESQSWHAILRFYAVESRTFTVGQATVTFSALMNTLAEASSVTSLDFPAPVVEQISVDSHQLNSDGSNVPLDVNAAHSVSLLVESSPAAQLYYVIVAEVTINGAQVDRKTVLQARSTESTVTIPPGTFKTGSMYVITGAATTGGYTKAAEGDLDSFSLPYSYTTADSGLFTVVAP